MKKVITDDDSVTFYNSEVEDHYHTKSGAKEEAFEKHAKALDVSSVSNPVIFDMFFGLGYNSAAAMDMIKSGVIYCFENDKEILRKVLEIDADFESFFHIKKFVEGFLDEGKSEYECHVKLVMLYGDAREKIKEVDLKADFVFFDPFSPSKVPEHWTEDFFRDIKSKMKINGKLSTYSYARVVRDNLSKAGFEVKDGPVVGRRSPSTIAINLHDWFF